MISLLSPSIILFVWFFISCSFAAPVQQYTYQITIREGPSITKIPSGAYLENYNLADSLDSYYSRISEKVLDNTISEIMEAAPESYLIIHELQLIGKDYCRSQLENLLEVLEHNLNHKVRNSILSSIRPLVDGIADKRADLIELNTVMSQQLGSILSAKAVASNIIRQIYQEDKNSYIVQFWKLHSDKIWAETVHHELNEFIALEAWLHSWLMDFEYIFKEAFDTQVSTLIL
ncbi:uncharacterized protein EV154DRAFT_116205 [Mucor mucedo]|uniref:uncharacterized protein n=1 Tax=Mucor mucedo TaxID=29922 RepID=UPI00221F1D9B|nr:uncharacterized protein EV154DRAFT_116205 [Mucor mucedo]KAI7897068.1 hypothetical protein EV154DRAFT_116205 [Mucor mucedo]